MVIIEREKVLFLHIPKTGGSGLALLLFQQLSKVRRNYFLSFTGRDDSDFFHDQFSTPRAGGNRCVIETIFANPALVEEFRASPHFQQAKLLFGHTTTAFGPLFPAYNFRCLAVVREPIQRALSNILQFSTLRDGLLTLGSQPLRGTKASPEYWQDVLTLLRREFPVPGLARHENLFLRDCMTRVLMGSRYLDLDEPADHDRALEGAASTRISFFDDFNAGLQRSFDALGVPADLSRNARADGRPVTESRLSRELGPHFGAPPEMIEFVAEHNQVDARLYASLRARAGLS